MQCRKTAACPRCKHEFILGCHSQNSDYAQLQSSLLQLQKDKKLPSCALVQRSIMIQLGLTHNAAITSAHCTLGALKLVSCPKKMASCPTAQAALEQKLPNCNYTRMLDWVI
jgi:hypothetical protein